MSKRTERQVKAAKASLISIFHYGLEAAFITTQEDSLYIGVNEGFLILSGYSREEILGRTIEELNFGDSATELVDALELVRTTRTVCDRVLCFRTKSGGRFEAMLSAMPVEVGEQACILSALHGIRWRRVELGDCTAADGETDIGIGIGGEAAAHGYQQPAQSALRTRASSIVF